MKRAGRQIKIANVTEEATHLEFGQRSAELGLPGKLWIYIY